MGESAAPRWSVMIPAHRPNHYVVAALCSVLDQAPSPDSMQIEDKVVKRIGIAARAGAVTAQLGQDNVKVLRQRAGEG